MRAKNDQAPYKILIVEDEMILNYHLSKFLGTRGYDVEMVNSGEKCLEMLKGAYSPDLILMDINLGRNRMNGPQTARIINQNYDIPVVLHSAYTDEKTVNSTREMTKYGYIQKVPGNEQVVAATIEMALKLHGYEKKLVRSERFLTDVFNSIQDGICVINRDYELVQVNHLLRQWFIPGLEQEFMKDKKCYELFQQRVSKCENCPTCRAFRSGETETEVFYDMHGLLPKWIQVNSYPMKSADGAVTGVVEHIRDITELKQSEQKIRESYARSTWLNQIGRNVLSHWSAERIIEYTLQLISDRFPKYSTLYGIFDQENSCIIQYSYHAGANLLDSSYQIDFSADPPFMKSLRKIDSVEFCAGKENRVTGPFVEYLKSRNIYALLGTGINLDDAGDAFICFTSPIEHEWTEHERMSLHEISDYLSLAIRNIRYQQLLGEGEQKYRDLSNHLQGVWEEQNEYIAREIHDDLGQAMTALKMNLYMIEQSLNTDSGVECPARIGETVEYMRGVIDDTVLKVRELSRRLRPMVLDTSGIIEALEWLALEQKKYSGLDVSFETDVEWVAMEKDRALAVFRIVQEALNNSIRHSKADKIDLKISKHAGSLSVSLHDNGAGFDPTAVNIRKSFGIFGMRERTAKTGGKINIESSAEKGTSIQLTVPLE